MIKKLKLKRKLAVLLVLTVIFANIMTVFASEETGEIEGQSAVGETEVESQVESELESLESEDIREVDVIIPEEESEVVENSREVEKDSEKEETEVGGTVEQNGDVQVLSLGRLNPSPGPNPGHNNDPWTSTKNNSLNFFVNLAGDVLDSKAGAGQHAASLFTSALTSQYSVDGNRLQQSVYNSSYYKVINTAYDAIVGQDSSSYASIDGEIRNVLSSYISFPSDASILANVKSQVDSGTRIQTVNGTYVSSSLIADDYYDVYWYVLKEANDFWHVDGILVQKKEPQAKTYDVTYSWTAVIPEDLESVDADLATSLTLEQKSLPNTVTYREDDTVIVDTTYRTGDTVSNDLSNSYEWVFSGWDKSGTFNITEDTNIAGTWTLRNKDNPVEKVSYTYEWSMEDPDNPGNFLECDDLVDYTGDTVVLPTGGTVDKNTTVTVDTTYTKDTEIRLLSGGNHYYTFTGWNKEDFTITGDTVISGQWELTKVNYTINYLDYDNGNQLISPVTGTVLKGTEFNWYGSYYRDSINLDGKKFFFEITADPNIGEGIELKEDYTVDLYYRLRAHVVVHYKIKGTGTPLRDSYGTVLYGHGNKFDPSTVKYDALEFGDKTYVYDSASIDSLEPIDVEKDTIITLYYTEKIEEVPEPPVEEPEIFFTITHRYKIKDTDTELMEKWELDVKEGESWKFSKAPETIAVGDKVYELVEVTGAELEGDEIAENLTRTAWYTEKVTPQPEQTEQTEQPEQPEQPKQENSVESHIDAPKTGDTTNLVLFSVVFVIALGAILVLVYKKRK